jgi:hypothetical protein
MSKKQETKPSMEKLSRRVWGGAGSAGLATAALASPAVNAQERTNIAKAEKDLSVIWARKTSFSEAAF